MPFSVIPAIDVSRRRLASWSPDGVRPAEVFDGDPLRAGTALAAAGAAWLHVVDMDHALEESEPETSTLARLREGLTEVRLQASGGVRPEDVEMLLEAGADRVVLGSRSLIDPEVTASLLARRDDVVLVGIEVADGRIRPRGSASVDLELMESLGWLAAARAQAFLVTSVARVGLLSGPDVETIRRVVRAGRPVLVAGDIASLDDLRAARSAGAVGAVVGRAALDGSLDLRAAFDWAAGV